MSEQVAEQEEQEEEVKPRADGKEAVDFNELPEEIRDKFESRFKRVYGNMKEYERIARTLEKDQKALIERLEKVETTQVQDRTEQRIESIKLETQAALEAGDIDKAKGLQDQLATFIREASKPAEKPAPQEDAYIPPESAAALRTWANELDDDGNFRRPWAQPQHGRYDEAIEVAERVYQRLHGQGMPVEEILEKIEKQISTELFPKKPSRAQAVLSADGGVTPTKEAGAKLTADQIEVAHRMYPKMTPKDAEARYLKAMKG